MTGYDLSRNPLAEMSDAFQDLAELAGLPRHCDDYPLIVRRVALMLDDAEDADPGDVGLAAHLVNSAAQGMWRAYCRRLGVSTDGFERSEWDVEARGAVASVLRVLVANGRRHQHLWLSRSSLAAIAESLEPARSCDVPVSPSTAVAAGLAVPTGGRDGQPTRQEGA